MSSITVYIISEDGNIESIRSGDAGSVMLAVDIEDSNYTLQPPPDLNFSEWRWIDNEWIATE